MVGKTFFSYYILLFKRKKTLSDTFLSFSALLHQRFYLFIYFYLTTINYILSLKKYHSRSSHMLARKPVNPIFVHATNFNMCFRCICHDTWVHVSIILHHKHHFPTMSGLCHKISVAVGAAC